LDLGHYERFIDIELNKYSNLTTGKVYWNVLNKERNGEYLGETVQIIPHITNEIKDFIYAVASSTEADVVITEIGGTVGDIESQPHIEAIRQVAREVGRENSLFIHVTLVPYIAGSHEYKSKPTQHSVREMQAMGISPDIIVLRSEGEVGESIIKKVALLCNVDSENVIQNKTLKNLYAAPLMLEDQNITAVIAKKLGLGNITPDLREWRSMIDRIEAREKIVKIAIVGKYVSLHDSYFSVIQALYHAGYELDAIVDIVWINSEDITDANASEKLKHIDGILVPGGFGERGVEGMISTCKYARENGVPYFGICLGMQISVIEFARNVLRLYDATSSEFNENTPNPVIDLMEDQHGNLPKGGTMRLGAYPCNITTGSNLHKAYNRSSISERHRHRYEFNNSYRDEYIAGGMSLSGLSPDKRLVEAVEVVGHPFFIGVQYHPEFKSRPNRAHKLFRAFVEASL
jgi:CTP synthase